MCVVVFMRDYKAVGVNISSVTFLTSASCFRNYQSRALSAIMDVLCAYFSFVRLIPYG